MIAVMEDGSIGGMSHVSQNAAILGLFYQNIAKQYKVVARLDSDRIGK